MIKKWRVIHGVGNNHYEIDGPSFRVSFSASTNDVAEDETKKRIEDANLIAAAPTLLALVVQYSDDLRRPPTGESLERRISAVSHAIAEAVFG